MKQSSLLLPLLFGFAATAAVHADDVLPPEDTMMVVEEATTPEDIVNVIPLPVDGMRDVRPAGTGAGEQTAEAAREGGRAFGQSIAADARQTGEQARVVAQEIADEARAFGREMAEGARGNDISQQIRDELQQAERGGRPENAGPPVTPGRPN